MKLFCFPYAGGSAVLYNRWKRYLDADIELRPIELAGRGMRLRDSLYKGGQEAVLDVLRIIKHELPTSEYAFFGHSMGAMIAYELAHHINKQEINPPAHIFFSGRGAPHIKREGKIYHLMNEDEFKQSVLELGGTPREFFDHPELMEILLPVLKNDFKLSETEMYAGPIRRLPNAITVLLGKEDNLSDAQCVGWKEHTDHECHTHYFSGGHFFLHDHVEEIASIISKRLIV